MPPATLITATLAIIATRCSAGTVRQAGQISTAHGQLANSARSHAAAIPPSTLLHLGPHLLGIQLRQNRGEGRHAVIGLGLALGWLLLLIGGLAFHLFSRHFQKFDCVMCRKFSRKLRQSPPRILDQISVRKSIGAVS